MFRKILKILSAVLLIFVLGLGALMYFSSTPLTMEEANAHLTKVFSKLAKEDEAYSGVQFKLHSEGKDYRFEFAEGQMDRGEGLELDTPFHIASVGKLFTATMIYQLEEEGKISLKDGISQYLDPQMIKPLFRYEGVDYADQVTLDQLLSHTSGVADYFGGPVKSGKTMETLLLENPEKLWQPKELIDFSAKNQVPIGKPGEVYAYSDTGYILLGLLIEAVTKDSFEDNLKTRIFEPLNMQDTYMALRQEPLSGEAKPIADLWLKGSELGKTQALSVDWAGGGLISTLDDLMAFNKALFGGQLISKEALELVFASTHQFEGGIYNGAGGMSLHFDKFMPLLKLPVLKGHIGVLSTYLFYDESTQTHMVMNLGSTDKMVDGVKALIEVMNTLKRME